MNWELRVDRQVSKHLKKIPKKDAEKIISIIEGLVVNPYAGDIEKMQSKEDVWRRRVGAYRVFYEIHNEKKIIYVYDMKRRTTTTY
ncbi:type II toxin-antitoxin system RelE/ParE family toxin [Candidatus Berkelbacteria bacterium]|nr:type II toxin-antitoxin system RelE/ParE family toxin [Candidatus Berkelbacteria bacterium]